MAGVRACKRPRRCRRGAGAPSLVSGASPPTNILRALGFCSCGTDFLASICEHGAARVSLARSPLRPGPRVESHLPAVYDVHVLNDRVGRFCLLKGHETEPARSSGLPIAHYHLRQGARHLAPARESNAHVAPAPRLSSPPR